MDFCDRITATLDARPDGRALEYAGRWHTWADVKRVADDINAKVVAAGGGNVRVGVVVRNRAVHAATLLGLLARRISISLIYAFQSPELLSAEVRRIGLPIIVADKQDWPVILEAARAAGSAGIVLDGMDNPAYFVPGLERSTVNWNPPPGEPSIEVLSSGTTGAPKRLPMPFRMLNRAVASAPSAFAGEELPVQVNIWPFGGVGGICLLTGSGATGAPLSIMEKFSAEEFAAAVRRNKPKILGLSPTAVRMIVDADIPKSDFASVTGVYGGSARLDPELQDKFEKKFGVEVYWGMGATEFCGTLVQMTPALRAAVGDSKRGSIGKTMPGVTLRVVDPETGAVLPPGREGLMEVLCPEIHPGWVRTTDLIMIDADGYVFHIGRNDGAIVRGGFKILPERVAEVIRTHPDVADAVVVGLDDSRLGAVPVAAVELRSNAKATAADLEAHVRRALPAPQVPAQIMIVAALPRTPSLKVALGEVRKLFAAA